MTTADDTEREPEKWPIRNALACLRETRDREKGDDERSRAVQLSMEYAIEVVKGINSLREPQPPDPAEEARRAVRTFCGELGDAFENFGRAMHDIADGHIPEGD